MINPDAADVFVQDCTAALYDAYMATWWAAHDDGAFAGIERIEECLELETRILDELRRHFEACHLMMPEIETRLLGA